MLLVQFVHRTIAMMPIPTVFALTGHAPAGAILLAVFGDYRIMPEGSFKTGLNEVRIGLFVPDPPFSALVRLIGSRAAEKLVVGDPADAETQCADEQSAPPGRPGHVYPAIGNQPNRNQKTASQHDTGSDQ